MKWSRWFALMSIALLLGGCAAIAPQRMFAHEAELLKARGAPTRVWPGEDGMRTLEYATQPNGDNCWMYTVDPQGRIVAQHDALSAANLARVEQDMRVEEVERLLGQHRSIQRFALSGEEVWDWNIVNEWPDLLATRFNVHFIDGKVVRTSRSHVYRSENWIFGIGLGRGGHSHWGLGWGWPMWRGSPHPW